MENRIELCCHTKMSTLQGINSAREYVEEAINRGYKSIAITDTDSTQSFFYADEYLRLYTSNTDFKIIYGSEMHFKISENTDKLYSIYIYVKEQKGLKNLYELISKAYRNIINGTPVIYKEDLIEYRSGLLYAAIGNHSEVYQNIEVPNINDIMNFYDFIGIEPSESNQNTNIKISELCSKNNKLLIGTSECNFINKEDCKCNEVLNFYKKNFDIKYGNNKYFHTTEELIKSFDYIENSKEIVIDNPTKITEQIENITVMPQRISYSGNGAANKIISKKCYDKAKEIYGTVLPEKVKERLELELNSIENNNYAIIYQVTSEIVEYSNKLGYEVTSRGSAGNSFVAYLLGITDINSIECNLPYEFFTGKDYDKEPDIDLNFSEKIRPKIFEFLQEKYGKDKIIWCSTIATINYKTLESCYKEYVKAFKIQNISNGKTIVDKLYGIKSSTGEQPGGILIIPENMEITDICPTEIGENGHIKTHNNYYSICNTGLYRFDLLESDIQTMLHELEKETNIKSKEINLKDKETLKLFKHANDLSYPVSIDGIPRFGTSFVKGMLKIAKPQNFNDLVCMSALSNGTGTWNYNAETLIEKEHKKIDEVISNREDMYNYLLDNGIEKNTAYEIVEFIRDGKLSKRCDLWKRNRDKYYIELKEKWDEYKKILQEHNIPEWYIKSAEKIRYISPKSYSISYTKNEFKIAWYKVHYPKVFYKVYFEIKSDLNINDFYCKRQVQTELNRLYDLKEIHDSNLELDYDKSNDDKIIDLKLILEMFNRGLLKEKTELKDDYNLINSRAIGDYCRSIKHKFNIEELAVLVYRNKRMTIEEKIKKYTDLINNYPDMEVIERINCKHYDSVKTMIKEEIQRLNTEYKELTENDSDSICVWTEYNKSTLRYEHNSDIKNTFRTFKEAFEDIQNYIEEYDDTISFQITKKYFNKNKEIYAKCVVENTEIKLINIENNSDILDIDQIFLNIPTPFKKGDILVSKSRTMFNYGDYSDIFVLDYLCTWKEGIEDTLAKGNYDSSDMIGYGYYLYGEDSTEFVLDHKWDYDSFEYYDGELTENNRILKDISSFVKGKISLELFVHAYDYYKNDYKNYVPNYYTDEGLKLAGLSEEDIKKINHR